MDEPAERPKIAREPISLALPVRDQSAALEAGVTAWVNFLNGLARPYELLVLDDGSRDDTPAKLDALAGRYPRLRVLRHFDPRGFGAAIRTALGVAQYPLFAVTTLDFPYAPADLKKLLDRIDDVDLVNGYRADAAPPDWIRQVGQAYRVALQVLCGLPTRPPLGWRGWANVRYSWTCRLLFGLRVQDIDSGLKLFRRAFLARIPIQSDGPFVFAEVLSKANFLGAFMDEVPIAEQPGPFPAVPMSPVKGARSLRAELGRVFNRPDFGPYVPEPTPTAPQPG
jgi:hypothetical protein